MEVFDVYKDIQARTNGEIYLGVVGPVRTGKSTFIKRFMDLLVLPKIEDEHSRQRTKDELPQSASGKTIMTTEPKFVPKEAAEISLMDDVTVKVRLIDCVGYMVKGAAGHTENEEERQVKTPWFDYEIPFTKAASIGTQKVIHDHATIGIVITTDGTICDLMFPRQHLHPLWNIKLHFRNRKFKQYIFHDPVNILLPQLFTVKRHRRNPMLLPYTFRRLLCLFPIWSF